MYAATGVFCAIMLLGAGSAYTGSRIETEKRVREITAAHSADYLQLKREVEDVLQQQKEMDAGGVVNFSRPGELERRLKYLTHAVSVMQEMLDSNDSAAESIKQKLLAAGVSQSEAKAIRNSF